MDVTNCTSKVGSANLPSAAPVCDAAVAALYAQLRPAQLTAQNGSSLTSTHSARRSSRFARSSAVGLNTDAMASFSSSEAMRMTLREELCAELAHVECLLLQAQTELQRRLRVLRELDNDGSTTSDPSPRSRGPRRWRRLDDLSDVERARIPILQFSGLAIDDPQPERDDSTFGGSQVAYRRAYRTWHAREQRRKKIASARSSTAPAPTAQHTQSVNSAASAAASAVPTSPPATATATISRDGDATASITTASGSVSVTRDASGSITATATPSASSMPPSAKHGKLPVQPHSSATDPAPPTSAPLPAEQPPATKATPVSASAARASRPIVAADLLAKSAEREAATRPPCPPDGADMASFEARFLHEPSADQRRAFADVARDMIESPRPMQRLVCGDVGFGKTEVAMRAIYRAVCAGRQAAVLVPREPLAMQHYRSLLVRMPNVRIRLLVSDLKASEKAATKRALSEGDVDVLVGTSAILAANVTFANLGLLVVDEEQLFGVREKETLKSTKADVLLLSATPIPRTSALHATADGARSVSNLATPPMGRLVVETCVCERNDEQVVRAVQLELARSGQVLYVVPWIEMVQCEVELLRDRLPGLRLESAHGELSDLALRIDAFRRGEADVLVATTVIECGIDIARANTIIIQDAVRIARWRFKRLGPVSGLTSVRSISRWQHLLGLSQLHQLRGRVGRGSLQAYAYLMHPGLEQGSKALNRLNVMQEENALGSGFAISRRDLQLRGAGSLFGEAQKGSSSRASVEVSQYQEIVQRVAAAPDAIAAAASFANEAEATGVTNATSHWEAPTLSGSDEDAMSSDVPCMRCGGSKLAFSNQVLLPV